MAPAVRASDSGEPESEPDPNLSELDGELDCELDSEFGGELGNEPGSEPDSDVDLIIKSGFRNKEEREDLYSRVSSYQVHYSMGTVMYGRVMRVITITGKEVWTVCASVGQYYLYAVIYRSV